jgi:hypothetical protein
MCSIFCVIILYVCLVMWITCPAGGRGGLGRVFCIISLSFAAGIGVAVRLHPRFLSELGLSALSPHIKRREEAPLTSNGGRRENPFRPPSSHQLLFLL